MKILFAGGGTGGHLYSGIALADFLRQKYPDAEILFVGTPLGLEKKIVPECDYELKLLPASPLKGSGIKLRLKSLLRLPKAYFSAKKILKDFQPDWVLGIGGYASGPTVLAAHFAKIPTAIIEQNAYPGFTNRKLARFVDLIFITFKKAGEFFPPHKTHLTGNPVRTANHNTITPRQPHPFTLFILGGSQGAHALNQAILEALPFLKGREKDLHFIHQTGEQDFAEVKKAYQNLNFSAEVFPFSQNIVPYYQSAHLILCRAGAGTITELRLHGRASLLVPYPYATDDHQKFNALELVEAGAAELKLNQDLNGAWLAERIQYYETHREELEKMETQAKAQAKPEAAREILNFGMKLLEEGG